MFWRQRSAGTRQALCVGGTGYGLPGVRGSAAAAARARGRDGARASGLLQLARRRHVQRHREDDRYVDVVTSVERNQPTRILAKL
jgi:hypothetical protein